MTKTILITGANRGIGIELARQYTEAGCRVHACCRQPEAADNLQQVLSGKNAEIHQLDVTDQASIDTLKS